MWHTPIGSHPSDPCSNRHVGGDRLKREGQPLHVLPISPSNLSTLKSRFALDCTTSPRGGVVTCAWLPLTYIQEVREGKVSRAQFAAIEISTASLASGGWTPIESIYRIHVSFQHNPFDTLSFWSCHKVHTCQMDRVMKMVV